jgi:hypothetical protein
MCWRPNCRRDLTVRGSPLEACAATGRRGSGPRHRSRPGLLRRLQDGKRSQGIHVIFCMALSLSLVDKSPNVRIYRRAGFWLEPLPRRSSRTRLTGTIIGMTARCRTVRRLPGGRRWRCHRAWQRRRSFLACGVPGRAGDGIASTVPENAPGRLAGRAGTSAARFGGAQGLCAASWPWPERCGLGLAGSGTGVKAGQAGTRNPHGYQGRHESTLLSRQPWRGHECRRQCTRLWMNCAIAQDGGASREACPESPLTALPAD